MTSPSIAAHCSRDLFIFSSYTSV